MANICNFIKKKYVGRFKESLPIHLDLLYQELNTKNFDINEETLNFENKEAENRNLTYINPGNNVKWLKKCLTKNDKIEDYRVFLGILYKEDDIIWGKWALYNINTKKITLRSTVNKNYQVPKNRVIPSQESEWYIHQTELSADHLFWKKLYDILTILNVYKY